MNMSNLSKNWILGGCYIKRTCSFLGSLSPPLTTACCVHSFYILVAQSVFWLFAAENSVSELLSLEIS